MSTARVFIDSSVLFSAALSSTGYARDLIRFGARGSISLLWSETVIHEVEHNLSLKTPRALPAFHLLRDTGIFEYVAPPEALIDECKQVVIAKDAAIVAACIHAQVGWLATYDQGHLLSKRTEISDQYDITTARPDEILESLGLMRPD